MTSAIVPILYLAACVTNCNTICAVELIRDVHDGDTVSIDVPGSAHPVFSQNIPVRIAGIQAPELDSKEPCEADLAVKARDFLRGVLAKTKQVHLYDVTRDKYFRLNAQIIAGGKSVGQMMLDQKLAVPYGGDTKPSVKWCDLGVKP